MTAKFEVKISEDIYHLACQQSNLGAIKLLVKHAKNARSKHDVEDGIQLLGSDILHDCIFSSKNEYLQECLNDKSSLGKFMRELYKQVFGHDYSTR